MTSTTENYSTFMNTIKKCYDGILLQKFTHLCVSTILYKRRLLPTSCFKAVHFGQTEAVILKNETNNITHKNTIAWLDVVLDAIEKNYVSVLLIIRMVGIVYGSFFHELFRLIKIMTLISALQINSEHFD